MGVDEVAQDPPAALPASFFERALAAVDQAVVATDVAGTVRYWNAAAERLFGYSAAEAIGRPAADLVVPADDHAAFEAGGRGARAAYEGDVRLRDKAGRVFTAHLVSTPITGERGDVVGVLGLCTDVTERRTAEAGARRLAAIVENSDDAIIETDLTGTVRAANRAVADLFGYRPDEMIGLPVQAIIPADQAATVMGAERALLAGGNPGLLATRARRRDGSQVGVSLRLSTVRDSAGKVIGVSGIARDVTEIERTRAALLASEGRFRAMFEQIHVPQALGDLDGRLVTVNDAFCRMLGTDRAGVEGARVGELLHPSDDRSADPRVRELLAGRREAESWERVFAAADGSPIPVSVHAALLREPDGTPRGIAAVVTDLRGQRSAERALRDSEARHRAIADTAQEGIWATDEFGRTWYANRKLADILGVDVQAVYDRTAPELLDPDDAAGLADDLRQRPERGAEEYDLSYAHPDGRLRVLRISISPLRDDLGRTGSLAMIADVTDARRAEQELSRRALRDELTGLANRTLLNDRLAHSLAASERRGGGSVAVLFADLDQFKLVNDSWGHAAGDRLLVQVADRLSAAVRHGDTVARFGGDKFVVVCDDTDVTQAQEIAGRLLSALAAPFKVDGQRAYVRASVGIAVSPPEDATELLRYAESAMYDAKARGRGRLQIFDASQAAETTDRLAMSNDLRDALENDELALHYQPVVELATGRVVGVEALARWHHPTRGHVSPGTFVEVAEGTGMALALGRWAVDRARRDVGRLQPALGRPVRIAVNISARHLADPGLEDTVLEALHAGGLGPGELVLEITESAIMENPEQARALLQRLQAHGVETAIDDFGTGYSSLGYLHRLPVTTLKIDRSFIKGITVDPDALAITSSIIELARAMGLTTVAEGVETPEQLTVLRRLGCTAAQGFLWSPAVLPEALAEKLDALPGRRFDVSLADAVS